MYVRSRRRLAAGAVIVATALAVAGCGSKDSGGSGSSSKASTAAAALGTPNKATGSPVKIGVLGQYALNADAQIAAFRAATAYANAYLGGLNGHEIQLDECTTMQTPATATACGVQFAKDGVVATIGSSVGDALSVFKALKGSGIPYVTQLAADLDILGGKSAYVLSNPTGVGSAGIAVAKQDNVKTGAIIVVDVPSASGPVKDQAEPLYQLANIKLLFIPISLQVADPTPQVQQAINGGAQQITVFGDETFVAGVIKAARQLGFEGKLLTQITSFPSDQIAAIPGGTKDVVTFSTLTQEADDPDRVIYDNVITAYPQDGIHQDDDAAQIAFQDEISVLRAVALTPSAGATASSVDKALHTMPKSIPLFLSGGMTFQCGSNPVVQLTAPCTAEVLETTLGADGTPVKQQVLTADDLKATG